MSDHPTQPPATTARYNPAELEPKWQKFWAEQKLFEADDKSEKERCYILDMFPYPSGAGLHVGHPEGYTATDIVARKRRAEGYAVLHPMGWDAFGLPAENYAIKTGTPPAESTRANITTFKRQIQSLGFSYDWTREIATCDPEYYRWTQWWFLFLFKQGLAYQADAAVNWCDDCKTVLANEQVIDGSCDRCKNKVVQKKMRQWFFKITDFIEDKAEPRKPGRAVLLHGFEGSPESSYLPWLRAELAKQGWQVEVPQLPHADKPRAAEWLAALDALHLDENTTVIGHSLGAAITLRWLEKRRQKLAQVVLVAAPLSDVGIPEIREIVQLPVSSAIKNLAEFAVIHSTDDHLVPTAEAEATAALLGVPLTRLTGFGHFPAGSQPAAVLTAATTHRTHGLLSGLATIDWPESTKINQENWIGRSTGLIFKAKVQNLDLEIETFSAHFEACYADTFVVIAPDHALLPTLVAGLPEEKTVLAFAQSIVDERAATRAEREPTGIFTGRYLENPLDGKLLPIWVASYALANYGTGIVKCSAHDERDFAFAKKYGIPLKTVLFPADPAEAARVKNLEVCYTNMQDGILTEPAELAGKRAGDCRQAVIEHCAAHGFAQPKTTYRLRDWLVSRQRYWGAPIPIIHCEACGAVPVPESELPVKLPTDVDFRPTGESPLALSPTFHDVKCPNCGSAAARRESDTMDTFVCSSWYYFAFAAAAALKKGENPMLATRNSELATTNWLPVDLYVGGAEHTVLHLLYSRFFNKVAHAAGLANCDEPFGKLRHQGMILGEDNQKMSKSRGNVVNPDSVVAEHGADTLRLYEMFMGPFEGSCPWNTAGVAGVRRFLDKVWKLFTTKQLEAKPENGCPLAATPAFRRQLHATIKKVSEDIEEFSFNTAVSQLMIFVNFCSEQSALPLPGLRKFLQILAPFAPHLAEELWQKTGGTESIQLAGWPKWDPQYLVAETLTLAVQVNGKLRDTVEVPADSSREAQLAAAKASEKVQKYLVGALKKEIVVPGKLVNFVVA